MVIVLDDENKSGRCVVCCPIIVVITSVIVFTHAPPRPFLPFMIHSTASTLHGTVDYASINYTLLETDD
jgi:hypothetical protein